MYVCICITLISGHQCKNFCFELCANVGVMFEPRGATRTEISYAIARNARKSVRNHENLARNQGPVEISEKSEEKSGENTPFLSEHAQ